MKPHIVILGGGFGGVRCALDCVRLMGENVSVTLIDKNGYHFFTPTLYEIASAYQADTSADAYQMRLRKAVAIPYSEIFAGKNIEMVQAEISSVDAGQKQIFVEGGGHIDYDYLVIALGSQANDFGIPGVYEYAYQFKTPDDAVALNKKLEILFQQAAAGSVQLPLKFFIIGAGFTGIELASELVLAARKLQKKYQISGKAFTATIFEAAPTILPMVNDEERKKIMARLTELGVIIMAGSQIESVMSDSVKLKNGQTISGTAVIWTAGVQPNKIVAGIHGLEISPKGRIVVNSGLEAKGVNSIFAIGDIIEFMDEKTQKPVPGFAYTAQAQGKIAAFNIKASMRNKLLKVYKPIYNSWVAPVGGKYAIAHLADGFTLSGINGWFIRNFIDLRYFMSILPPGKALKLFQKDLMLFSKND